MGSCKEQRGDHLKLKQTQDDFRSAAIRHIRDAKHLLSDGCGQSIDQAWHLAGFAPECIRKACLIERWGDKPLGHLLGADNDALLELLLALDPPAWRYSLRDWGASASQLTSWKPDHRYDRTGSRDKVDTIALVDEAETKVFQILAELWADGRIQTLDG